MSDTALDLDIDDDFDPGATPPLTSFCLATPGGRFGFLWALSELGPEGLLTATHHLWNSLNPPQSYRATLIAQSAGLNGKGKPALFKVLSLFLETFEQDCQPPSLPDIGDFPSPLDWNAAIQQHFADGEAKMKKVIARFDAILNSAGG